MPAILYPLPKIVKNFNTVLFTGGTPLKQHNIYPAYALTELAL